MAETEFDKYFRHPCQYCGECPVWLAAFEKESDIQTDEDLHKACQWMVHRGNCDCYGKYVSFEELGDNCVMKNLYNRLVKEKGSDSNGLQEGQTREER